MLARLYIWLLALAACAAPAVRAILEGLVGVRHAIVSWCSLPRPRSLPLRAFSSGEVLYTWDEWRRDAREIYPIRFFVWETLPRFFRRVVSVPRNALYWICTHTVDRYHMVDIRTPTYRWGWIDMDEAILNASFNLLQRYVEEERKGVFRLTPPLLNHPADAAEREYWEKEIEADREIAALYAWWTYGREMDYERVGRLSGAQQAWAQIGLDEYDQIQLHRLVNVRQRLWT